MGIINDLGTFVGFVAVVCATAFAIVRFVNLSTEKQLETVREWLLYATTEAEKELGGGTGRLKLRLVYDMFVSKFTWLARLITFERFSALVDESLVEMNDLLATNAAVANYVAGVNENT